MKRFARLIKEYERQYGMKPHSEWIYLHGTQEIIIPRQPPKEMGKWNAHKLAKLSYRDLELELQRAKDKTRHARLSENARKWETLVALLSAELTRRDEKADMMFQASQIYVNDIRDLNIFELNRYLDDEIEKHVEKPYYTELLELIGERLRYEHRTNTDHMG